MTVFCIQVSDIVFFIHLLHLLFEIVEGSDVAILIPEQVVGFLQLLLILEATEVIHVIPELL